MQKSKEVLHFSKEFMDMLHMGSEKWPLLLEQFGGINKVVKPLG